MQNLNTIIKSLIDFRKKDNIEMSLLAVCPNSEAVLEAAVKSAMQNRSVMLFAATLNQVDNDGGYTGWTPDIFVKKMHEYQNKYQCHEALYPCLDHGGPWLKDKDSLNGLSYEATFENVKKSIESCVKAGYSLLHIDPTVDRSLAQDETITVETVVDRTVDLIACAEQIREQNRIKEISYEVGTEEVHGGMVDLASFERFIVLLRKKMEAAGLSHVWPCFFVAQVGTDLHTTRFDANAARSIYEKLVPTGSLAKGHYSDWVENPEDYPLSGMGGANIGPEFTTEEYLALEDLSAKEKILCSNRSEVRPSNIMSVLQQAVVDSGRWKKWLQPDEKGNSFATLSSERRNWLVQTGVRYIWAAKQVVSARQRLYNNLAPVIPDPHDYVVDRIVRAIDRYIIAFKLFDSVQIL